MIRGQYACIGQHGDRYTIIDLTSAGKIKEYTESELLGNFKWLLRESTNLVERDDSSKRKNGQKLRLTYREYYIDQLKWFNRALMVGAATSPDSCGRVVDGADGRSSTCIITDFNSDIHCMLSYETVCIKCNSLTLGAESGIDCETCILDHSSVLKDFLTRSSERSLSIKCKSIQVKQEITSLKLCVDLIDYAVGQLNSLSSFVGIGEEAVLKSGYPAGYNNPDDFKFDSSMVLTANLEAKFKVNKTTDALRLRYYVYRLVNENSASGYQGLTYSNVMKFCVDRLANVLALLTYSYILGVIDGECETVINKQFKEVNDAIGTWRPYSIRLEEVFGDSDRQVDECMEFIEDAMQACNQFHDRLEVWNG